MKPALRNLAFVFSIVTFFISGCKYDPSSGGTTNTSVTPKPGTTYTYSKHEKDSVSGQQPTTTDSTIIATVIASDTTYQGKSKVIFLYDDFDTLHYIMESDNDVSVYLKEFGTSGYTFSNPTPWMKLPFGSKQTGVKLFTTDTLVNSQAGPTRVYLTGVADYVGPDQIAGKANGGAVKVTIHVRDTLLGTAVDIVATQSYSFDPSIGGYFHSIMTTDVPTVSLLGTTVLQGNTKVTEKILTDYSLKK